MALYVVFSWIFMMYDDEGIAGTKPPIPYDVVVVLGDLDSLAFV
jgi:hypothetical protein